MRGSLQTNTRWAFIPTATVHLDQPEACKSISDKWKTQAQADTSFMFSLRYTSARAYKWSPSYSWIFICLFIYLFLQNLIRKVGWNNAHLPGSSALPWWFKLPTSSLPSSSRSIDRNKALRDPMESPTRSSVYLCAPASILTAPWLHSRLRCCMETLDGELPLLHSASELSDGFLSNVFKRNYVSEWSDFTQAEYLSQWD